MDHKISNSRTKPKTNFNRNDPVHIHTIASYAIHFLLAVQFTGHCSHTGTGIVAEPSGMGRGRAVSAAARQLEVLRNVTAAHDCPAQ